MIIKHAAAGPYLGFALQPVRLCYHLLSAPRDSSVSLEYLDDVAVHYADGMVLLEQCKSALSHNPISDWSDDLWKTFANWLDAVEMKKVDAAKTAFQLYVTPAKSGKLSAAINAAADEKAVKALIKKVKDKLNAKTDSPKCIAHVQKFLDTTDALRLAVVCKTTVVATDADPLEPLRELLRPTVPETSLDVICASAIGQAKEAAEEKAKVAIERATKARNRPTRKVMADARKALELPAISAPDLGGYAEEISRQIEDIYQSAIQTIEVAALLRKRELEEEDDEDILLLIA